MTHVTRRLSAKNRDQLGTLRSVTEYGLALYFIIPGQISLLAALELTTDQRAVMLCGREVYECMDYSTCRYTSWVAIKIV